MVTATAEGRPVVIQGGELPVFQGRSTQRFCCGVCSNVLVEGYEPRALIAIDIECFKCKSVTRTEAWPVGEPLPIMLMTLGDAGRFLLKGTVDLREYPAISCDQEIQRITAYTSPRPRLDKDWELSEGSLRLLEAELDVMTGGALSRSAARVARARELGNYNLGQARYPIAWALAHLEQSLRKGALALDGMDGIAIAYLQMLRDALYRWRQHPRFHVIAETLCNDFHHGMTAFTIASYLSDVGNSVGITDTEEHAHRGRSPDLFVNVGRAHAISIEVKCPQSFFWPSAIPTSKDISRRLEKEIRNARDQIAGAQEAGIVVIGAGHFSRHFALEVKACLEDVTKMRRISTKVAAVATVCFFGPTLEPGPEISMGGEVNVSLNPRFAKPNPIEIGCSRAGRT